MINDVAGMQGLVPGEEIVLALHPHGKTLVRPALLLLLIVAAAVVLIFVLPASTASLVPIRLGVGALALVAAVVAFGVPFLRWRTTIYELTSRRLRLREGILTRRGRDFPLTRISDVSFSHGLLDRVLGCGRLVVESAGEHGQLVLNEIPQVERVQSTLFQLVEDEQTRLAREDS